MDGTYQLAGANGRERGKERTGYLKPPNQNREGATSRFLSAQNLVAPFGDGCACCPLPPRIMEV